MKNLVHFLKLIRNENGSKVELDFGKLKKITTRQGSVFLFR
jgi:hypothetical protein